MLRTLETLFVVVMVLTSIFGIIHYINIPSPRITSSTGLEDLAASTIRSLDENSFLTNTVFSHDDVAWAKLKNSIDSSLSSNIMYKLSVYSIETSLTGEIRYYLTNSLYNFEGDLPTGSEIASITVTSPNVTYSITPEKIGARSGKEITLYVLNCGDANGWWTTGYSAQSLATDVCRIMSPYFKTSILVNSTAQLGKILKNQTITSITDERIKDAVIVNTFGEAVPIPSEMTNSSFYTKYPWYIGQKVNAYNWTWASIVGYPLYYVTNTEAFKNTDNTWGIYGMEYVGPAGLNGFLQGLDGTNYVDNDNWITVSPGVVNFSASAKGMSNFYGIFPESYQTATRALPNATLANYHIYSNQETNIFEPQQIGGKTYISGATHSHWENNSIHGSFTAIGMARTPDIRITILGLLMFYSPNIYRSDFGASGTSRLIVLQLGQVGGN
ncbi:hypothetical protein MUP77_22560 [Candidatus Bathyarchaeota archaeon]|nr:hypothetical protein [Candidatus Bathyarchaeota archaeon]